MPRRTPLVAALLAATATALTGCGGGATSTSTTTTTTAAATSATGGHEGHGGTATSAAGGHEGHGGTTTPAAGASATSGGAQAGRAGDVMFAQMMIPHHGQAVDLADMALGGDHETSPEVLGLARRIKAAQEPEIRQMQGMLRSWGAPTDPAEDMTSHMTGMVPEGDLKELQSLQGDEFDARWLELMIAHHQGAVQMAQSVLRTTRDPQVSRLADAIIAAQRTEIAQMEGMLD